MRKFLLLAGASLFINFHGNLFAQNKTLGVGVATPNSNAALHVESPTGNQGFIMPRLTTIQRKAMNSFLTAADKGLMLYDTDLNTVFIWDGVIWKSSSQVAGGPQLVYPYADTIATSPGSDTTLFKLLYTGTATRNVAVARFENQNSSNKMPALWVETNSDSSLSAAIYGRNTGLGDGAASFRIENPDNSFSAAFAQTNGSGPAIFANQIGGGRAGQFQIQSANNPEASLRAYTDGIGRSGFFTINNAASTSAGIFSTTNGSGPAVEGENTGTSDGFAGNFNNTSASNTYPALQASTAGSGSGMRVIQNKGTGPGIDVFMQNAASLAPGFSADQIGFGPAGVFQINNANSGSAAISATTNGRAAAVSAVFTGTGGDALYAENKSAGGSAGNFYNSNDLSMGSALNASTNSAGGLGISASNGASGIALAVLKGGLQISTSVVTTASIATRASAYQITTGGTSFSLDFGPKDGEVFMIYNETTQTINILDAGGTPIASLLNGEGKTFIVFPGSVIRAF